MLKVLFVDDEALVRMGLLSIIDWNAHGFDIVGEVSNGKKGLQVIKEKEPDLVVTDIVMQEMDGLEMIEQAKIAGSHAIFIVLSSYDEFDLVKRAMQLGAVDYILKLKISQEVVEQMIENIKIKLTIENKQHKTAKTGSTWSLETLQKTFFTEAITGFIPETGLLPPKLKELDIQLDKQKMRIAIIRTDKYSLQKRAINGEEKLMDFMILNIMKEISNEFFTSYALQWTDDSYVIVLSENDNTSEEIAQSLNHMFETIIEMLKQFINLNSSIGVSEKCSGYENLKNAFTQANRVIGSIFREGYGKVLYYEQMKIKKIDSEERRKYFSKSQLMKVCELLDVEGFQCLIEQVVEMLERSTYPSDNIKDNCCKFLYFADDLLGERWEMFKELNKIVDNYSKNIYMLQTMDELIALFRELSYQILKYMERRNGDETFVLVKRAKQYIWEHRREIITLKDVADYLHISTGYLSGIFSKYDSRGFIHYINYVKIMEAKKILKKENYKIYEVSFMLGYENSGYFSKVFKKIMGCTPKEYIEK